MICNPIILGSGSTGNGTILYDCIQIDCGLPFIRIAPYLKEIQLILLTHRHSDHFNESTVRKIHAMRPTLRFACCEWMVPLLIGAGVDAKNIDVLTPERSYDYGKFAVEPFPISHDVPNCGWKIFWRKNTSNFSRLNHYGLEKVFYATDACNLTGIHAEDFDLYMIECNHGEEEIRERIAAKEAAGEYAYEVNAARNHLSWEQAMAWLAENGPNGQFIPMHQHVDKGVKDNGRETNVHTEDH